MQFSAGAYTVAIKIKSANQALKLVWANTDKHDLTATTMQSPGRRVQTAIWGRSFAAILQAQ